MAGFLKLKSHWKNLKVTEEKAQADKDARDAYFNKPKEAFRLRYTGPDQPLPNGNRVHLVPLPGKNLHTHFTPAQIAADVCPTCQQIHSVKTIHLWIEPNNTALVSRGVMETIQKDYPGGLPAADLTVDGGTEKPPELKVGDGKNRRQIDQENASQTIWSNNG